MICSRPYSAFGEAQTRDLLILSPAHYHWATPIERARHFWLMRDTLIMEKFTSQLLGQIKKYLCLVRIIRPYLLLVNSSISSASLEKKINLCILTSKMPFKMHPIILFPKKTKTKKLCVPTHPKIFRPVPWNTHIFLFGLMRDKLIMEKFISKFLTLYARHQVGRQWYQNYST